MMITRIGLLTHTPRKFPCVNVCELWDVMYAREPVKFPRIVMIITSLLEENADWSETKIQDLVLFR